VLTSINRMRRVITKYDITLNQAAMLSAIPHCDALPFQRTTPSEVAEIMGISRGGVTRLVRVLIDRKLVVQSRDPLDHRFVFLKRTRKGDAMIEKITSSSRDVVIPENEGEEALA
jgi:DNA-binding MarR family transcriptional regulator